MRAFSHLIYTGIVAASVALLASLNAEPALAGRHVAGNGLSPRWSSGIEQAERVRRHHEFLARRDALVDDAVEQSVPRKRHARRSRKDRSRRGSCSSSSGSSSYSGSGSDSGSGGSASASAYASDGTASAYAGGGSASASASASSPTSSSSSHHHGSSGNSTSSSSGNSTSYGGMQAYPDNALSVNGIMLGALPDEADAGGTKESMTQLNALLGGSKKLATYGYYAQAQSGKTFDGSQLLAIKNDLKQSGAIFEPAVMPTGGWQGLTQDDNSQAVAIAKVMKQFTDDGIEVRLRFGHEVNYYQTDGTYQGNAANFKEGWATVAAAIKQYAPDVKMFFTPNVANMQQYEEYFPDDINTVDLIGIDYYPKQLQQGDFVAKMKEFHDKYTNDRVKFAIGETGLGYSGSMSDRLAWLKDMTSDTTKQQMPNFIGATWFNFQKGEDFRIFIPGQSLPSEATQLFGTS